MFIEKLIEMEIQQANKTHSKTKGSEKKTYLQGIFSFEKLGFLQLEELPQVIFLALLEGTCVVWSKHKLKNVERLSSAVLSIQHNNPQPHIPLR